VKRRCFLFLFVFLLVRVFHSFSTSRFPVTVLLLPSYLVCRNHFTRFASPFSSFHPFFLAFSDSSCFLRD
jgi:hypothetical protein